MIFLGRQQCKQYATKVAVLLEAGGKGALAPSNKHVVAAARRVGEQVIGVVLDKSIAKAAQSLDICKLIAVNAPKADLRMAENACNALSAVNGELCPDVWMSAHSAFGKNIMPRLSALLSIPCISDVTSIISQSQFKRPIYAGNAIATVECKAPKKAITIRSTAFEPCRPRDGVALSELAVDIEGDPRVEYVGLDTGQAKTRPELGAARVVISGGRALRSKEEFEALIGGLADVVPGSAIGASRAAVDAGLAPNDLQVGQTGKVVAPALYMAIGISGAIQHMAGMKDSKVIVAINKDGDCPIFQVADYGLVGDIFTVLPELTEKIKEEMMKTE